MFMKSSVEVAPWDVSNYRSASEADDVERRSRTHGSNVLVFTALVAELDIGAIAPEVF